MFRVCEKQIKPAILFSVSEGDACKLYCRVDYSSNYYLLSSSVVDGTPCTADSFDKCVAGTCVTAGCDHQLDSTVKLGEHAGHFKKE